MTAPRTIAAFIARNTLRVAAADGLDVRAFARRLALDEAGDDPLHPLDLDVFLDVYGAIVRRLDDPGWPIRLANRLVPEDYSVIGFAVMTATTGLEAMERGLRYQQLSCPASGWRLDRLDDRVRLTWLRSGPPTLGHRAANEGVIAEFVQMARNLFGGELALHEVTFRHSAPPDTSTHAAFFECPIRFDAEGDSLLLPADGLERSPLSANPAMAAWFARTLDARLADQQVGIVGQVERQVLVRLPSGTPGLNDVARDLGMSARTLRRRLTAEGTRFQDLLDAVRRREAEHHLASGRASVAEVAWVLGFSDASAFTRACRRWFGRPPGAVGQR